MGGGDIALDNCLRLKRNGSHPTLFHRDRVRANAMLALELEQAGIPSNIGDTREIEKDDAGYTCRGRHYDHLAAFIGREPALDLVSHLEIGEIRLPHGETSTGGLYIIGDAVMGRFGQATLAAGMGLAAAMHISTR